MPSPGPDVLDVEIDRPSDVRRWPGLLVQPEVTQDPSNHSWERGLSPSQRNAFRWYTHHSSIRTARHTPMAYGQSGV